MRRTRRHGLPTIGHDQGFTVVEILIAATVVVVAFLALATVFPRGYSTVTKSGAQSLGLALAQQRIEFLRNQGHDNITVGTSTESSISGYPGYTRITVVQGDTPAIGAKQVTMTVTPPSPGITIEPIQLTTVVAK